MVAVTETVHKTAEGRKLTDEEVSGMADLDVKVKEMEKLFDRIKGFSGTDQRWHAYAVMQMQVGLMALRRSVNREPAW